VIRAAWHPLARRELFEGSDFYDREVAGLGESFTRVEKAVDQIRRYPHSGPVSGARSQQEATSLLGQAGLSSPSRRSRPALGSLMILLTSQFLEKLILQRGHRGSWSYKKIGKLLLDSHGMPRREWYPKTKKRVPESSGSLSFPGNKEGGLRRQVD
jgi:hypothetical protein